MQVLIVYNPVSGSSRKFLGAKPDFVKKELEKREISYTWFETVAGDSQPLDQFLEQSFDRIIVMGGDGTVRAVAHWLADNHRKTPLAIIGQGTGNMVALCLGIPVLPGSKALDYALTATPQPVDMILINKKHHALIAAGQGYDAVFMRETSRDLKRKVGFLAYVISFCRTFFTYTSQRYSIVVDGERFTTEGKLTMVCNMISALGAPIDSEVSPQDGTLDLYILNPRSVFDFFHSALCFVCLKRHRVPRLQVFTGKRISINQKYAKEIQVDGDVFAEKHLDAEVVPGAIEIVYEKKFS